MKVKKLFKSLLLMSFAVVAICLFSACDDKKIAEIYLTQTTISVPHNSQWTTTELEIKAKLTNNDIIDINAEDCEFSNIDTSVVGTQTLTVTYGAYSAQVTVNVYKTVATIEYVSGLEATYSHNQVVPAQDVTIKVNYSNSTNEQKTIQSPVLDTTTCGQNSVTLTYNDGTTDFTTTYQYTVVKTLASLEVVEGTFATSVAHNSPFPTSTIKVKAIYSDTTSETLNSTATGLTIEGINTATVGDKEATISLTNSFGTASVKVPYNVYKLLSSIEYVSGLPTTILYGTDLDLTNLKIKLIYSDESFEDDFSSQDITVTGYDKTKLTESQTLTITYHTKTASTTISVYETFDALVVEAATAGDPTATYCLKSAKYDTNKLKISARYTSGRTVALDNASVEFGTINTSATGEKKLTISYTDSNSVTQTTEQTITVVESYDDIPEVTISSIAIYPTSVASKVAHNGTLNLDNLKIIVNYSNGLTATLNYAEHKDLTTDEKIEATFSSATVGDATLTVTYKNKQADLTITVEKVLQSISVKPETKISSFKYTQENIKPDLKDVIIIATYSDTTTEEISCDNYTTDIEDFDSTELGDQTITFTYNSITCTMTVKVFEEIEELVDITGYATQINYGETLDTSEITAWVTYSKSEKTELANSDLVFGDFDSTKAGPQYLTISYTDTETEKTISKTVQIIVNDILESVSILETSVASNVITNSVINTDNLTLVFHYKSGATEQKRLSYLDSKDYDLTVPETKTPGEVSVTVVYKGFNAEHKITVNGAFTITSYTAPENLTERNIPLNDYANNKKGFTDTTKIHIIGDDNNFQYNAKLGIKDTSTQQSSMISEFPMKITLSLFDNNQYTEVSIGDYTDSVDYNKHTINFNKDAIGHQFKIVCEPNYAAMGQQVNPDIDPTELIFKVIDAYNVYDAKELSLIDNQNYDGKWDTIKTELGITETTVNGIVLQDDILIEKADLPAKHFYSETEANFDKKIAKGDQDYNLGVTGSLIDNREPEKGFIYYRILGDGETFTIEGNYYILSAQNIPLIIRQEEDGTGTVRTDKTKAITTHTALFGLQGKEANKNVASYEINNVNLFGNSQKSEDALASGGVMFLKSRLADITVDNCFSQSWFISYMFEGNSDYSNNTIQTIENSNMYDCFNTMLYCWAAPNVVLKNNVMIGAGGPLMICDDVEADKKTPTPNDPSDDKITNVTAINCIMESWIVGTEGWFQTYTGSDALVAQLKATDRLFNKCATTILDKTGTKINLVAVYKSGHVEGLTDYIIYGSFNPQFTDTETTEKYVALAKENAHLYEIICKGVAEQVLTEIASQDFDLEGKDLTDFVSNFADKAVVYYQKLDAELTAGKSLTEAKNATDAYMNEQYESEATQGSTYLETEFATDTPNSVIFDEIANNLFNSIKNAVAQKCVDHFTYQLDISSDKYFIDVAKKVIADQNGNTMYDLVCAGAAQQILTQAATLMDVPEQAIPTFVEAYLEKVIAYYQALYEEYMLCTENNINNAFAVAKLFADNYINTLFADESETEKTFLESTTLGCLNSTVFDGMANMFINTIYPAVAQNCRAQAEKEVTTKTMVFITDSGAVGVFGATFNDKGEATDQFWIVQPDATILNSVKYLYVYLPNGMVAVVEIDKLPAQE